VLSVDEGTLYVVNPDSASVSAVDLGAGALRWEAPVGQGPAALSLDPAGERVYVAVTGSDSVVAIDALSGARLAEVVVDWRPAGVVVSPDGARLFVASAGEGLVTSYGLPDLVFQGAVEVGPDPHGLAMAADGATLYVTDLLSGDLTVVDVAGGTVQAVIDTGPENNASRQVVLHPEGDRAYLPLSRSRVASGRPTFENTVMPRVVSVDLGARRPVFRELLGLDTIDRPVGLPSAAAFSPDGRLLYVVNAASDDLSVVDLEAGIGVGHVKVGSNPRGIVVSADGLTAWVHNALSDDVSVVDLATLEETVRITVTDNPLPEDVLAGKVLFHSSARPEIARDGWISCASCHLDGGHDGRTWVLADGPRNTTPIRGLGSTFPFHWSGDRVDVFDFQATVREVQFGTGLSEEENAHLAAFLAHGEVPASPYPVDAATKRGEQVFAESGCATCHAGGAFTDGLTHDVGTGGAVGEQRGPEFDTPTLLGLYDTAPYLHDGRAPTLRSVFAGGEGPHADPEGAIDDLVSYLRTLPQG
jgi:YVTN family beta-propeller protein